MKRSHEVKINRENPVCNQPVYLHSTSKQVTALVNTYLRQCSVVVNVPGLNSCPTFYQSVTLDVKHSALVFTSIEWNDLPH